MLRNSYPLILILSLTACGGLSGKTPGKTSFATDLVSSTNGGTANQIAGYSPAPGTYTSVPGTIQVNFASGSLEPGGAQAVSTYSISCGGYPLAAQSVTFQSGLSSVSVILPSITGLADGTLCTFSVSISLRDSSGNFIIGQHTANYTISSTGGSVTPGGLWSEAATAVNTSTVGNSAGLGFMGVGGNGAVMTGLMLNGGTYVNGVEGLWTNGFGSNSVATGPAQGATNGGFSQLACPSGYRMTGITGRAGAYIDAIAILCASQDQSQTYTSSTFGGSGGNSFTLQCPAGRFVTDLDGMSDGYLEQISLGCR